MLQLAPLWESTEQFWYVKYAPAAVLDPSARRLELDEPSHKCRKCPSKVCASDVGSGAKEKVRVAEGDKTTACSRFGIYSQNGFCEPHKKRALRGVRVLLLTATTKDPGSKMRKTNEPS